MDVSIIPTMTRISTQNYGNIGKKEEKGYSRISWLKIPTLLLLPICMLVDK